jgi:hypothetical protein
MALMTEVCWRMKRVTSTVQRQAALLLGGLGRDEPHVWPGDCFTNRLGIPGIVLMALVHVGRRYRAHSVAEPLELARSMMRRGAGFDLNQATLHLATNDHLPNRIDAMNSRLSDKCDADTEARLSTP